MSVADSIDEVGLGQVYQAWRSHSPETFVCGAHVRPSECFLAVPASRLLLRSDGHTVFDWLKVPRVATLHSLSNLK